MKKNKTYKISRLRAIEIASNHNRVSIDTASRYTTTELNEVLKHLKIKAIIIN